MTGNLLMPLKQLQLGPGIQIRNDHEYSRIQWCDAHMDVMYDFTAEWYYAVRTIMDAGGRLLNASPVMLMGMLNAGSAKV